MVDVDVLIKTRLDVETFKTVTASLTRKIVEEGKLLYGQSKAHFGTELKKAFRLVFHHIDCDGFVVSDKSLNFKH